MATVSPFSSAISISISSSHKIPFYSPTLSFKKFHFQFHGFSNSFKYLTLTNTTKNKSPIFHGIRKLKSAEEETQSPEEQPQQEQEQESQEQTEQPTVSVPVSPSDTLTMFFQAEGAMNETAIPAVTSALEGTEGVTDLKVQVQEGIASVELTKQTTVQATGVASSLVELIQGSGFKLQTLNLSFADEEDALV